MKLHTHPEEFRELITVVANEKHISESAVERDYYIVMMLKSLADSPYADQCVFKGGTSLSKCYPGSIDRFSEDIDLTFLGMELSDKACDKAIKKIETIMAAGAQTEKIVEERSNRSKSMYVWFGNPENRVKLEIGSTVRPDPYQKMPVKTCIQEFLESRGFTDDIERFELETVEINTLNIERTFIDKIMSVKRHAICGTLNRKVRHIYDVTRLYQMPEIQAFLAETDELKRLVRLTKDTDSYYIGKRNISAEYDPTGAYDFDGWQKYFDADIRITYETLHTTLLYTDEKQDFDVAVNTFKQINGRLTEIGVNPKFCVNAKLWCKIEQKYFKAGAAQAAAAFSTKITALRGDVKGRGVSLRSSRLLTFRLQPVSPACGRQRTPLTVRELRSSPAAFRSTSS